MNFRKFRGLAAVAVAAALVLSGCGSSDDKGKEDPSADPSSSAYSTEQDSKIMASIKVEAGEPNTAPTKVTFDSPLGISAPTATLLSEGTGDETSQGSLMSVNLLQFDGSTGEQQSSTYESGVAQVIIQGDPQIYPELTAAFEGQKVGAKIAFATPKSEQSPGILFIMELSDILSDQPTGQEVAHVEGNPAISINADGLPELDLAKDYKATSELQVIPLIKGEGDVVGPQARVTANYSGWKVSNGEKFDSSFDRGLAFQFATSGGVIEGWLKGVQGQTVGSRVLLVVPKEMGYGGSAGHELEKEDLIFVVDILAVEQLPEQE